MVSFVNQVATEPNEGTCKVGGRCGKPSRPQEHMSVVGRGCRCSRSHEVVVGCEWGVSLPRELRFTDHLGLRGS